MSGMFRNARSFNQDIGMWNVSAVIDMQGMFQNAESFSDSKIVDWDVSSVHDMSFMFSNARSFNQDVSSTWNLTAVTNVEFMFSNAASFDQDLCPWSQFLVDRNVLVEGMLENSGCSASTDPPDNVSGPFCATQVCSVQNDTTIIVL